MNLPSYQSYATVGDLDITGNKITIEAVFMRTAPYGPTYIWAGDLVTKHVDPVDINYLLRPNNAEITTTNGYITTPPICEIELNKIYHVAFVYNGSTLKFYRNGYLMASVPATGNLAQNNHLTKIGYYDAAFHNTNLIGYINEVRIWNVERSQAELRSYMNTSLPSPTTQSGLLAYYQFDNLLNKQGNTTWNATLGGTATINATAPNCNFFADSCTTRTPIGNIINDYTPLLGLNKCDNTVTVEDGSAFKAGDTVLMMQMKGAQINTTNSASFGTVTNYNNAGNYEFNYIKSRNGNLIELKNVILRNYDIPTGKVQLVRVPYYQNAYVSTTLSCLPWDGNKGGVLVLNAADSIVLNANIDVSGKGFRGGTDPVGTPPGYNCFEDQFYYPINQALASEKGEGIAVMDPAMSFGKGAYANGGGGGNSHNSGGGGGGNSGSGGTGGYNYEGAPCNSTVPFDNRGLGGKTIPYSNVLNKIHPGGGGGAGHTNSPEGFEAKGGNGAGIILLMSNKIKVNNFRILANGNDGAACGNTGLGCHEGMGGGGAGGTVISSINEYVGNTIIEVKGGKGADVKAIGTEKVGPGGGGSGGVAWLNNPALPATVTVNNVGGTNGVSTANLNNPWGASAGQAGTTLFNLNIPASSALFKRNIDSVRYNHLPTGCSSFNFEGLAYINSASIASWEWKFGDGNTAVTQNAAHSYSANGPYIVKLIATDINGCKDSISKEVIAGVGLDFDFNYSTDFCNNPLSVQFNGLGNDILTPYWSFGDATVISGNINPVHIYPAEGNYIVKYSVSNSGCADTVTKNIFVGILRDNIIVTPDTTICSGTSKQLRTSPGLDFCWTPVTYLDNPLSANPVTSATENIMYYFTAQVPGTNIIANGDFSAGNSGFTSGYSYAATNTTEGQYYVGTLPQSWNTGVSNCKDHTTTTGNMMMVNGSPVANAEIWKQTLAVVPNTNYAFSCWIQSISVQNPAQLQFSVNNNDLGNLINASSSTCTWQQFYGTWNSGSNTTAIISIVNKNTIAAGNDFALDDISFAPLLVKRDSVFITVNKPAITATNSTSICEGSSIQLQVTGAENYIWTGAGLNNSLISNPVATPLIPTRYIVEGTNSNGCIAKDTVDIGINLKPAITRSENDTICNGSSIQLTASGGVDYLWSPPASLDDPASPDPIATPTSTTRYYITVTDINTCTNIDSIDIFVRSVNDFKISPSSALCKNDSLQLKAEGGHLYSWFPVSGLNDPASAIPNASPAASTLYTVVITDTICHVDHSLETTITILPLPIVTASKDRDIDCIVPSSKLYVVGAKKYNWFPATGLSNVSSQSPVASPEAPLKYFVTGTDANGCRNIDSIMVNVSKDAPGIYLMPNAFTPNNDDINDCFGIKYWGQIKDVEFSIYNRWGETVFYTTNPGDCWDGSVKGVKQSSQVFIYMIRAATNCESSLFKKGTFTLIR